MLCQYKVAYDTQGEALGALEKMGYAKKFRHQRAGLPRRVRRHVYYCRPCRCWHIGKALAAGRNGQTLEPTPKIVSVKTSPEDILTRLAN
jgi:hypothetical protein